MEAAAAAALLRAGGRAKAAALTPRPRGAGAKAAATAAAPLRAGGRAKAAALTPRPRAAGAKPKARAALAHGLRAAGAKAKAKAKAAFRRPAAAPGPRFTRTFGAWRDTQANVQIMDADDDTICIKMVNPTNAQLRSVYTQPASVPNPATIMEFVRIGLPAGVGGPVDPEPALTDDPNSMDVVSEPVDPAHRCASPSFFLAKVRRSSFSSSASASSGEP